MRLRLLSLVLACVLCACQAQPPLTLLPSKEVLRRTSTAMSTLKTFETTSSAEFTVDSVHGSADIAIEAVSVSDTESVQNETDISLQLTAAEYAEEPFVLQLSLKQLSPKDVFFMLNTLTLPKEFQAFALVSSSLQNQWFAIDIPGSVVSPSHTAGMVEAQAELLDVTKDHGLTTLEGRDVYLYTVELNPEGMLSYLASAQSDAELDTEEIRALIEAMDAHGRLWIDAREFYLVKAEWNIKTLTLDDDTNVSGTATVYFDAFNKPVSISKPQNVKRFDELLGSVPLGGFSDTMDTTLPHE